MSLWSSLLTTYQTIQSIAGITPAVTEDMDDNRAVTRTLLPLYHTTLKTQLRIVLDDKGQLLRIDDDSATIIIPCTESSMGRSRNIAAHPMDDQLQYLDRNMDPVRYQAYMDLLGKWKNDNVKLNAVYSYLSLHSIVEDAKQYGVSLTQKSAKNGVRFLVEVPGDDIPCLDQDKAIRDMWISYMHSHPAEKQPTNDTDLLGTALHVPASNYPKNIISTAGNAKLISANDDINFTFRGRFRSREEALCIDSDTSQQIHTTLKWLINTQGTIDDTQAIVVWKVGATQEPVPSPMTDSTDLFSFAISQSGKTDSQRLREIRQSTDFDYARQFHMLLRGYKKPDFLADHGGTIAILVLDAATSGRLSAVFYRELAENDYIETIMQWHIDSSWELLKQDKQDKDSPKIFAYKGAPSFTDIANCTYKGSRSSANYRLHHKKIRKQLIECMFGNRQIPYPLLQAAFRNVTHPMGYDSRYLWERYLRVACSMWKKHYIDDARMHHPDMKGEITMKLDPTKTDRDYLFGRLLALADDFESSVLYRRNAGSRPTNAIKLMSNFTAKPYSTWGNLWKQLVPYLKADPQHSYFFMNEIDTVMGLFRDGDYESNKPLSPLFLLGFSAQRLALQKQRKGNHSTDESISDSTTDND